MTLQGPHQVAKQSRTMSVSLIAIASLKSSVLKSAACQYSVARQKTSRSKQGMAEMSTHFKRLWTPSFLSLTLDILLVDAKGRGFDGVVLDAKSGREKVARGLSLGVRRRVEVSILPSVLDVGANII
jgi:hypothetical protein